MASSLLDRVKRPPQSAETFIAAADAAPAMPATPAPPKAITTTAAMIEEIAARDPGAVVIIESALIFETKYGGEDGWYRRFDKLMLVRASEELKIARFVARASSGRTLNAEARRELWERESAIEGL